MLTSKLISLKLISQILLILTLVDTVLNLVGYFQVQHQLVSPIIPESLIKAISKPYLRIVFILFPCFCIAFLLYWYKKYIVAICLCAISIVFSLYFFDLVAQNYCNQQAYWRNTGGRKCNQQHITIFLQFPVDRFTIEI